MSSACVTARTVVAVRQAARLHLGKENACGQVWNEARAVETYRQPPHVRCTCALKVYLSVTGGADSTSRAANIQRHHETHPHGQGEGKPGCLNEGLLSSLALFKVCVATSKPSLPGELTVRNQGGRQVEAWPGSYTITWGPYILCPRAWFQVPAPLPAKVHTGKQQVTAQMLGIPATHTGTWTEFPPTGSSLAQTWLW